MNPACHHRSATAEAFSSFLFPHVLFVESFIDRRMAAAMCWLAWNLSQVYDADQREREVMRACRRQPNNNVTCANNDVDPVLQNQIRDLIACKRHLFPHMKSNLRYWLEILDDIRANTEAVLGMFARQEMRDINLQALTRAMKILGDSPPS